MSVREEDREKNSCSSRGLGLAAAAIGVGVGAALYYFFSKRPENPDGEGSTHGWQCEEPQTLLVGDNSDDSYITVSEYSTTDTSIEDSIGYLDFSTRHSSISDTSDVWTNGSGSSVSSNSNDMTEITLSSTSTDSDISQGWEVTTLDVPNDRRELMRTSNGLIERLFTPLRRNTRQQRQVDSSSRAQAFRERTWSLEECSICFDVILKDQEIMSLPCTHFFHTRCILPWLQEQQTCPNCRKSVD